MIDLRSSDEALSKYTERYDHLLPPPSPQLRQRMDFMLQPDAPKVTNKKPGWLSSRPCTLTEEQALDRAKGCLLGLAIGDAVVQRWSSCPVISNMSVTWWEVGPSI